MRKLKALSHLKVLKHIIYYFYRSIINTKINILFLKDYLKYYINNNYNNTNLLIMILKNISQLRNRCQNAARNLCSSPNISCK